MRLAVLLTWFIPFLKVVADDRQLKLDPPSPDPVKLIYDTQLTGNTRFCAATPVRQNLAIQVDCIGSGCGSEYTLAGSESNTLPISLQFTDNHSNNFSLSPGILYENLDSQGANCGNDRNVRTVTVTVNKNDIDWAKAPFQRTFRVTARNIDKNRIETEEFTVLFGEEGIIRISGLKDLTLSKENSWQEKNEQVCVVSSSTTYNLNASSANNGRLKNAGNLIPYTLQYKEHNTAIWKDLTLGQSFPNITASGTEFCSDGVYIGIQAKVTESDMNSTPAGNYSDTITLTVEAS